MVRSRWYWLVCLAAAVVAPVATLGLLYSARTSSTVVAVPVLLATVVPGVLTLAVCRWQRAARDEAIVLSALSVVCGGGGAFLIWSALAASVQ